MGLRISEIVERGLYPVKLGFNEGKTILELTRLSNEQFDTGFYSFQLEKAADSETVYVDLDAMQIDVMPRFQPAGYIYHLGRCGSTVTVNMLNALEQCQVIAEPSIFPDLITADIFNTNGDFFERRKKITILFCLLGERNNRKTIFKMASWEVRQRNAHFQLYPEVKSCLIVRNVLEIMVTIIQTPPLRFQRNQIRSRIRKEASQHIDDLLRTTAEKFGNAMDYIKEQPYVDFIGASMQGILRDVLGSTTPYLILDHKDVMKRVPTDLCAYFDIHPDKKQSQAMQRCARYHSKVEDKNERYIDDSARKFTEATPEIRRWCENTLQPMLEEIISKNSAAS